MIMQTCCNLRAEPVGIILEREHELCDPFAEVMCLYSIKSADVIFLLFFH